VRLSKGFRRVLLPAFLGSMVLGTAGCQEDNEAAVRAQAAQSGPAQPAAAQPKTQAEYFQSKSAMTPKSRPKGYPAPK